MGASRKLQAVVFDLDGLMVNSEPLARQAWDEVLADYGRRLDEVTYRRIVGRRTRESAEIVRASYGLPLPAEELAAAKTRRWQAIWQRGLPPMPGLVELQAELAARALPWAVATSSPRAYAMGILQQLGLADSCGAIAGGDEVTHGKPEPDIYLLAAERLGVSPEACLALEDSVPGARAAQAAGMAVVAIPNGTPVADFRFADHVLASLHEVASRLDLLLEAGSTSP
jgi:HAD superfamily hydrolase (TIGR01509 family)